MEYSNRINGTDAFAAYLEELMNKTLPRGIVEKAKECLIDFIGVTYTGANENKKFWKKENSSGRCTLINLGRKTDSREAAFVNAFNAHTTELDDGSRFGMIHLGAGIISAVIAAAEEKDISYNLVLKGIILGYEAAVRVALAIQPGHKEKGFHTSGTCGTIGAAVAVAVSLECNKRQLKSVISAAATGAAGLLEIQGGASTLKPYNLGHAAMSGLNAAYVGMAGFCGPDDILSGERGMLHLMSDTLDMEKLTERTDYYEIERIYIKPYAACRHCHPAIEAILALREKNAVPAEAISRIQVYTYSLAVKGHDHTDIKGISSAKLSLPFSVATAYINGNAGMGAFTDKTVRDDKIMKLSRKVELIADEALSAQVSRKRAAEVHIITNNNEDYCYKVEFPKGDPENPMTRRELTDKFRMMMIWSGQDSHSEEILKKIL